MPYGCAAYIARVQRARAVLGGKWKLEILCAMRVEPVRLSQLKRLVPTASKKALSASLRSLELSHLIVRHDLSTKVLHVEYDFAETMREPVWALLDCLATWDDHTKGVRLTSPQRGNSHL
jgi:DNA-binding HxlR family transcriptional regulator